MPYADPLVRKQKDAERKRRPEVREKDRENYRKRYSENANDLAEKTRLKHHIRWQDPEYREQKRQQYLKRWEKDWVGQTLIQIKAKCKGRGLEFNLTREDIHLPEKCPVFGVVLVKGKGAQSNNSPSVDRIDNSKGYVKGNVVVVSLRANSIKRDTTVEELQRLVDFYKSLKG